MLACSAANILLADGGIKVVFQPMGKPGVRLLALIPPGGRSLLRRTRADPLLRNTAQLFASGIISALLGFVFLALAARFYTTEVVGLTTATISAAGLVAMFSTAGMHVAVLRFLPPAEDKAGLVSTVYALTGTAALALMIVFLLGLPLWSPRLLLLRQDPKLALLAVLAAVSLTLLGVQHQVFIALRRASGALLQQSTLGVLRIPLIMGAAGAGLFGLMGSWVLGVILALAVGGFVLRRQLPGLRPVPRVRTHFFGLMTQFLAASHTAELLAAAPNFVLPLMVVNLLGAESNAYFFVPFSILSRGVLVLPNVFGWTLLAEGAHQPERLRALVGRALGVCAGAILVGLAGVFLLGGYVLAIFGTDYSANSLKALWILSLSAGPIAIIEVYIAVCRVLLRVRATVLLYASLLPLVVAPGYLLMSVWNMGIAGASLAWTLGQTAAGLLALVSLARLMRRPTAAEPAPREAPRPSTPTSARPQDVG